VCLNGIRRLRPRIFDGCDYSSGIRRPDVDKSGYKVESTTLSGVLSSLASIRLDCCCLSSRSKYLNGTDPLITRTPCRIQRHAQRGCEYDAQKHPEPRPDPSCP
jgi:hypothetical protein